ncbi:MAG: sulfite exporter TauE/SafE family protein [Burkholderiaceae bacterium]
MNPYLQLGHEVLGNPAGIIGFLVCVAVAAYAQTLTGFAFALILLSSVAVFELVPITDAANAAMVLTLVNAYAFFRTDRQPPPWRMMRPALISSLCFTVAGVMLLMWFSTHATQWLKIVLGLVIVGCAFSLMLQRRPRQSLSSPLGFGIAGSLSGILGGLFGTSGPPLVYLMYQQPLDHLLIRRALLLVFTSNSILRLTMVVATGTFTLRSLLLCVLSIPIVHFITMFTIRRPAPVSVRTLRTAVAWLLVVSGVLLVFSGWNKLLPAG